MVAFGASMLAIAVAILLLASAFMGTGLAIRRAFGLRTLCLEDCFLAFWVGYAVTLLFLILWNFMDPVGSAPVCVLLHAG